MTLLLLYRDFGSYLFPIRTSLFELVYFCAREAGTVDDPFSTSPQVGYSSNIARRQLQDIRVASHKEGC
jgi:hypothetical protein